MASSRASGGSGDRETREAAALRANLARRKSQQRARRSTATNGARADRGSESGGPDDGGTNKEPGSASNPNSGDPNQ
ncbi:hypothetical protein [Fodinicurvata sp. EGI_FJ10296]|uniref:hypothetical protein n=1 Tax=Fodinicurvata sp. EGI_FJ10296 TaxID=3231908 RepID=UPI003451A118